jgi:hypothetical protein
MAEDKNIAIEVEVKGVEKSIESMKDLKNAIKSAKDEQLKAASSFGEGSKQYVEASKKVSELKDKVDDLNDSTQSLRGSGVESLSSSFGLLGDGIKNLDLDKIKTGFKGLGSAMNAVPLLLLVTGITMLVEKFGIFEIITDAVVQVLYAFTDAIGLTNKADEKASAEMIENAQKVQAAKEEQYNSEIKIAQAAGQSTKELELEKLQSVENSIASQVKSLENLQIIKGKLNDEEQKQYDELQINLLKASGDRQAKEIQNNKEKNDRVNAYNLLSSNASEELRVSKLSEREKEIDAIRKQSAVKLTELNKKQSVDSEAEYKALAKTESEINELAQIEINKVNSKYNAEANEKRIANEQKLQDDLKKIRVDYLKAQEVLEQNKLDSEIRSNKIKNDAINEQNTINNDSLKIEMDSTSEEEFQAELKKANETRTAREKDKLEHEAFEKDKVNITSEATLKGLQAAQQLSDLFFAFKRRNMQKGSAEELAAAKKQFKINKALAITTATIQGVQGVLAAFSSGAAVPVVGAVLGPAYAVLAGVVAAANIAKIASAKFDEGGGGGGGGAVTSGGATPSVPIPSPPTLNTPGANTNSGTTFDSTGKNTSATTPTINVNATIGVDEINSKQNRVSVLEKQSTF